MTDHAATTKNSGHTSTSEKRGCHANTGTRVVTKPRRVRCCRRRGSGRESERGGKNRKRGGRREERGRGEEGRGETDRQRNEGTGSAAQRGQPGELPTPVLRLPRRGQRRGVRFGHWAKGGSRLLQDRWLCQIQVQELGTGEQVMCSEILREGTHLKELQLRLEGLTRRTGGCG